MCIVLLSTSHPDYPLILLNNRDEFLDRPTAPAGFWPPPDSYILGGRDLLRPERGTWLGVTRHGRIAVLTNFREQEQEQEQGQDGVPAPAPAVTGARSRGGIVNEWLKRPPEHRYTVEDLVNDSVMDDFFEDVGGFSLLCGTLRRGGRRPAGMLPLAVVSNRSPKPASPQWILEGPDEVQGLSNSAFLDPWPKVRIGTELLSRTIQESVASRDPEDRLVRRLFDVLSHDTLPARTENDTFEAYLKQLRHSIFIPVIQADVSMPSAYSATPAPRSESLESPSAVAAPPPPSPPPPPSTSPNKQAASTVYGTQKQTIILVNHSGRVTYVERTLFEENARPAPAERRDRKFSFDISGW